MIKIFKTNVSKINEESYLLKNVLQKKYPKLKMNFDLDDCDKILRIEGTRFESNEITMLLNINGFICIELD